MVNIKFFTLHYKSGHPGKQKGKSNNIGLISNSSIIDYSNQYYGASYMYGQQQQYPTQDCIDVLLEEAEKLYNKLVKELVDESISDYGCSISSPLPLLAPSD